MPTDAPGLQIRTYVVLDLAGRVIAVKLNRTSATLTVKANPGSRVEPHMADKHPPEGLTPAPTNGVRHAPDEHRQPIPLRSPE